MTALDLSVLATLPERLARIEAELAELKARDAIPDDGQLLDARGAAELLSMSVSSVFKAAARGTIPRAAVVRMGRRLRFRRAELIAWQRGR